MQLVLAGCLQAAPAPQPFLLDLFPQLQRAGRREDSSAGYGAPPVVEAEYGAPEVAADYAAPTTHKPSYTTSVKPCSYQAPTTTTTTTTTTAAPSYGAPRNTGGFPDILGFLGTQIDNLHRDIVQPKLEKLGLGPANQDNCLTAPSLEPGYGAPEAPVVEDAYEAPVVDSGYEAPNPAGYEAPVTENPSYSSPDPSTAPPPAYQEEVELAVNERGANAGA